MQKEIYLKDFNSAIEDYKIAISYSQSNRDLYDYIINLAEAKIALNDLKGASDDYNNLLKVNEKKLVNFLKYKIAKLEIIEGDFNSALTILNELIDIGNYRLFQIYSSNSSNWRFRWAPTYKKRPFYIVPINIRGLVYYNLNQFKKACIDWEKYVPTSDKEIKNEFLFINKYNLPKLKKSTCN